MSRTILVSTAAQSRGIDARAIAAGTLSRTLMQRASAAAAEQIALRYADQLAEGIVVYAGPGNNGGDAWGVARALAARGGPVGVIPVGESRPDDARAERDLALAEISFGDVREPALIVDGVLGTGARGEPHGEIAAAIASINAMRARGTIVVALDVPSGLDATTGARDNAVSADCTLTFGTLKRGLLAARGAAGRIVVLDIGLGDANGDEDAAQLVDAAWVGEHVPRFDPDAHKGTRKKLAIAGGELGMAGAPMLAARASLRTGAGIVRLIVAPQNVAVVQTAVPTALARPWPAHDAPDEEIDALVADWADAVVIGPGMGTAADSRRTVERLLTCWHGPVVVDADALNLFNKDLSSLGTLLRGRPALITPHPMEMARLTGRSTEEVLANRFDIAVEVANEIGATVMLKGVPTYIASPGERTLVSATGTPALATGGSGDLLAGIVGTLLAQIGNAHAAAACGAWAHGRAAELAGKGRTIRGVTLADVEEALAFVWARESKPVAPILAELPPIGDEA
ncbi:MAG: NAD(P)H-hydrate dehydratase [Gemmatimonadota bacterium]|nr:NAD(P)H-hydrate dehydratase [Gemmatimonadota bacterium]